MARAKIQKLKNNKSKFEEYQSVIVTSISAPGYYPYVFFLFIDSC